jgi:hypothetical protein
VKLNTIDNESGPNLGYGNYTNLSTDLTPNQTYNIELTPGRTQNVTQNVYWKVWIDLNGDNDFLDIGELVLQTSSLNNQIVNPSFTLPSNASPGRTRMRVSMGLSNGEGACTIGGIKEVEDYTVTIQAASSELSVTPNSVNFSCEGNSWNVNVRSNLFWTIVGLPDWLSVSRPNGTNDGNFLLTAERNPTTTPRTANIQVSGGGLTQDVSVVQAGCSGSCVAPTGLRLERVTYVRASLIWNTVTGASAYQTRVRYVGESEWSLSDTNASIRTSWFGLAPCRPLEVQVRSRCVDGTFSPFSSSIIVTTDGCEDTYCYSYGRTTDFWIDRVQVHSLNNNSGRDYGYGNFTNQSTTLEKGIAYQLFLTPSTSEGVQAVYWRVWIDYNQDGDFLDLGEKILEQNNVTTATISQFFSPPNNALTGTTRMRVSMALNDYATPCELNTDIEVEDYTINLEGGVPPNLTLSTSALSYSAEGGSQQVQVNANVDWTTDVTQDWITVTRSGTGNSQLAVVVQANPNTAARSAILRVNGVGVAPRRIIIAQAARASACAIPNGLVVEDFGQSYAFYNWQLVDGATGYQSRIRPIGTQDWIVGNTFERPGVVWANLAPCSEYELQIRSICDDGESGSFSPSMRVTTEGCDETYCYSYGLAWNDWINRVQLSVRGNNSSSLTDINNRSGQDFGHGDYTNISAILQHGNEYQLFLEPSFNGEEKEVYWRVWIDFNQDGDFLDTKENIVSRTNSNRFTEETVFSVPNLAKSGPTRMRVAMSTEKFPRGCDIDGFREVEDYTVVIQGQAPALEVSETMANFGADGGRVTVEVASNVDWRVTESLSWINVIPSSGSDNGTFLIEAVANNSNNVRTGELQISGGNITRRVQVRQAAMVFQPNLTINPQSVSFKSGINKETLNVVANTAWRISSKPDWITVSTENGVNAAQVEIRSARNNAEDFRMGEIFFTNDDRSITVAVEVFQEGKFNEETSLGITPRKPTVDASASCKTFNIRSIHEWELIPDQAYFWINSITPRTSTGNGNISICYSANNSNSTRIAGFKLTGGGIVIPISLEQLGRSNLGQNEQTSRGLGSFLSIQPNPVQEEFSAQLQLNQEQEVVFRIIDLNGRAVSERTHWLTEGYNRVVFDEPLPDGAYVLVALTTDGILERKLFVVDH